MARKLKVFQARFGFYDSVVAAPSQAAALRAWGAHQNLFRDGEAHETQEPATVEAATAHPETPLRRAVGTSDPFSLTPRLPALPDRPAASTAPRPAAKASRAGPAAKPPPPPPDRSALDAAEAAREAVEERYRQQQAGFEARRRALDDDEAAARKAHALARDRADTALRQAKDAFERQQRRATGRA